MYNHKMLQTHLQTANAVRVSVGSGKQLQVTVLNGDKGKTHSANYQNSALRCIAHYLATQYSKDSTCNIVAPIIQTVSGGEEECYYYTTTSRDLKRRLDHLLEG